jgi:hypothetical protein
MIKIHINNKNYLARSIAIENESGIITLMYNCAKHAGYGNFLYFIDENNEKHEVDKYVLFEINKNILTFEELIEES